MIKPDVMPPSDSAVWWFIICGTQVLASTNENSAELVPYGNAKFIPPPPEPKPNIPRKLATIGESQRSS